MGKIQFSVVRKECDISSQFLVSRDTDRVEVMTRGLAILESRGMIEKATAHPTLPRNEAGTEGR